MSTASVLQSRPFLRAVALLLITIVSIVVALQFIPPAVDDCENVTLTVVASTEKSDQIGKLADGYNKDRRLEVGGEPVCAQVVVKKLTSGAAELALEYDWDSEKGKEQRGNIPRPDVWTPTTSLWAARLEAKRGKGSVVVARSPAGDPYPVLARSPVVVAMPSDRVAKLRQGLPGELDWGVLLHLASGAGSTWGTPGPLVHGNSGWGRFWLQKDNAMTSSSGLGATISTFKAAYGKSLGQPPSNFVDIPSADLDPPSDELAEYVRRAEAGVAGGYVHDATEMMEALALENERNPVLGWERTSAVVVQEQFVFLYNTNGLPFSDPGEAKPKEPPTLERQLVPLYPSSGVLSMDHPYIKLSGLSAAKERIADDFLAFILARPHVLTDSGFRTPTGNLTDQLKQKVPEAAAELRNIGPPTGQGVIDIQASWLTLRRKAALWLLLDDSGTMGGAFNAAQTAAINTIEHLLNAGDQVELRVFPGRTGSASEPFYQTPIPLADIGDKARLRSALSAGRVGNFTPLYQNILDAYTDAREHKDSADREVQARIQRGEPAAEEKVPIAAVVVVTDGAKDTTIDGNGLSPITGKIKSAIAGRKDVKIFVIVFGNAADLENLENLRAIVKECDGAVYDTTIAGGTETLTSALTKALSVV